MATKSKLKFEKFQYDIDIQRGPMLYGLSGKFLYTGQWITGKERRVIIVEMNREIAEREARFYRELNNHDHIIRTFGEIENTSNLTIYVQEYAKYGDLANMFMDNEIHFSLSTGEIPYSSISSDDDVKQKKLKDEKLVPPSNCDREFCKIMGKSWSFKPTERINFVQMKEQLSEVIIVELSDTQISTVIHQLPIVCKYRLDIDVQMAKESLNGSFGKTYQAQWITKQEQDIVLIKLNQQPNEWECSLYNGMKSHPHIIDTEVQQRKLNGEKLSKPWLCNEKIWEIIKSCWYNEPTLRYNFEEIKSFLSPHNLKDDQIFQYEKDVHIKIDEKLHGKFGKVFHAAEWIPNRIPSILVIIMNEKTASQEVPYYLKFKSEESHIICSFGLIRNNPRVTILVQECAPHGNLQVLLQKKQYEPKENVLVHIFLQIIDAMIYMANKHIVHGNLCCKNILVFQMNSSKPKENLVKITNFSQACKDDSSNRNNRETIIPIRYCAPEILGGGKYSALSDIYSMGVLMWEAYSTGTIPYAAIADDNDVRQCIINGEKLIRPQMCNNQIWSIIHDCWFAQPEVRFNFPEMHTRLGHVCVTCQDCKIEYLKDEIALHQRSCSSESQVTPIILPEKKITKPTQPTNRKSIFQRIRSFFGGKE
ncbi:hypothetical protein I4U23_001416 [Adineta vaga]|nr:hypothetical protein I4U23_001416 [Adineta vaga]